MKSINQKKNADDWESYGPRKHGKKDYKHLVGSDKPKKKKLTKLEKQFVKGE